MSLTFVSGACSDVINGDVAHLAQALWVLLSPVVILEFAGATRYFAQAARITKRPDVAAALKHPELVDSGYDALLSFAGVAPGAYSVKVDMVTASGAVLQCDTRRKVELK